MSTDPVVQPALPRHAEADGRPKWRTLVVLAVAELLAMALWFSASAVVPQLTLEWSLDAGQQSWVTMSVQIGFVVGALVSAVLNLSDRMAWAPLFAGSSLLAAACNAAIPLLADGPTLALIFRFGTGFALAGVYPPAMKMVATWCKADRGLGIGVLVAAIALGSATPHLLNALPLMGDGGMPPWRTTLWGSSVLAAVGALLGGGFVRPGPFAPPAAPFDWKYVGRALAHEPTRLANFGYLGHMWELYAMWAWAPVLLLASYEAAGWSATHARLAGFATIAVGAVGSILAGVLADRWGRTLLASASLIVSGSCALAAGAFFGSPGWLTAVCLLWGFAVVADSAQFSAAVSELGDPRYVGTALTVQTSLGFLLTLVSIRLVPSLVEQWGWSRVLAVLALGPVFGVWSMLRLRSLPEATRMASGRR